MWYPANLGPVLLSQKYILSMYRLELRPMLPSYKVPSLSISSINIGIWLLPTKGHLWYISEDLVSNVLQAYSSKKEGSLLIYINKAKSIHWIGLPTSYCYQNCGEKQVFYVRAMFAKSYFAQPLLHNILLSFPWNFYHFTYLPILEWYTIRITKYYYDEYISIAVWGKSFGSYDEKVKVRYQKNERKEILNCRLQLTCMFIRIILTNDWN